MIDIKAKIHDKFSIEFKVGFVVRRKTRINDFAINTWFYIPNSLDINSLTYSKKQFYIDVKSNVRLITPVYLLREIIGAEGSPIYHLENSFRHLEFRHFQSLHTLSNLFAYHASFIVYRISLTYCRVKHTTQVLPVLFQFSCTV